MYHIRVRNAGRDYCLLATEGAEPRPAPTEVLIKVAAAGVNRADILQARGQYPPPTGASPILGLEVSGEIAAVGEEVSDWRIGDHVCALLSGGGYAQFCTAPAELLLPVPSGIDLVSAAALPEAYFTVWANVFMAAALEPTESILIHGGSSGIGTAAIQLCATLDHDVFTTAGTSEKCAACESLGAKYAINYHDDDYVSVIKDETGGRGVDVILDMIGGEYIQRNLDLAAPRGRIVNIAYQRGAKVVVDFTPMLSKRLSLIATTLRSRSNSEKQIIRDAVLKNVWPLLKAGKIRPVIDRTYEMTAAQAAHERMISSEHIGKILLLPN